MQYLYKIYDGNEKRYNKYIILDEEYYDSSSINLIHIFKHNLTEDKKNKILNILNEKINHNEVCDLSSLFVSLNI